MVGHRSETPRRRSRLGASAVALGLAGSVGACDGVCLGDYCEWPPGDGPEILAVAELEIVPDQVHASPGTSFTLRARARDASGGYVPVPPAHLSWTSVDGHLSVAATGNPVEVSVPATITAPSSVVQVSMGSAVGSSDVTVALDGAGDRLAVEHAPNHAPAAVLVAAREGGECQSYLRFNVAAEARLATNLEGGCPPERVAVFAPSRGALFEPGPSSAVGVPPWTPGDDRLERPSLDPLRALELDLRIHVPTAVASEAATTALSHAEVASAILQRNRTGIRVQPLGPFTGAPASFDPAWCGDGALLQTAFGIDLAVKRMHAIYVQDLSGGFSGYACYRMPDQGAQVVFVSWNDHSALTLAHELGHALGLTQPMTDAGHTGTGFWAVPGFDHGNLMWVGMEIDKPLARHHVSLGQAFRMNVHDRSWLVHELSLDPLHCGCSPDAPEPCPPLAIDVNELTAPGSSGLGCTPDPWSP